jgi:hypothetical protein
MGDPIFYSCQVGSKNYWPKDFRYLKPKRASVTRIYDVIGLEYGVSWGRFLYFDSITIRYKLFYWSRHFCPMKSIIRAETKLPFFLKFSLQS